MVRVMQRHRGEELPCDPSAQGRGQVAHGCLQDKSFGTTPELAANSAISLRRAKAAGPAGPNMVNMCDICKCKC